MNNCNLIIYVENKKYLVISPEESQDDPFFDLVISEIIKHRDNVSNEISNHIRRLQIEKVEFLEDYQNDIIEEEFDNQIIVYNN